MPDGSATPKPPKSAPVEVKQPPRGPPAAFTRPPGPPDDDPPPSGSTAKAIAPGPKAVVGKGKGKGKAAFGKAAPKPAGPPHRNNRGPSQQAREGRRWKEALVKATAAVTAEKESMEAARDQAYQSVAVSNATIMNLTQSRDRATAVIQHITESNNRALQEHGNRVSQLWSMYHDQLQVQRDEQNEAFEFQKKQFEEKLAAQKKQFDAQKKQFDEELAAKQKALEASRVKLVQSEREVARVRDVAKSQIEAREQRIKELRAEVERLTAHLNKMKAEVTVEQKGPSSGSKAKLKEESSSSLKAAQALQGKRGRKDLLRRQEMMWVAVISNFIVVYFVYCEFNSSHFIAGCIEASYCYRYKVGCHVFFASQTSMTSCIMNACSGLRSHKRKRPNCHSH